MKQSTSGAMIIEFIGTPGAGKTSLLPAVKEFFSARGLQPWGVVEASRPFAKRTRAGRLVNSWAPISLRGPLLWQVFYQASRMQRPRFRADYPSLVDSVERFQHERPITMDDREHVLRWFNNLTGQYSFLKAHATNEDVLIFDEGFTHRVVQLFASEAETLEPERIRSYLDLLPVPDLLIRPQASFEVCLERVHERGVWERFRDRDAEAIRQFMCNAHAAVEIAVEYIKARGWPLLQVDNENQSTAESARQLREKLASMYMTAPDQITVLADA